MQCLNWALRVAAVAAVPGALLIGLPRVLLITGAAYAGPSGASYDRAQVNVRQNGTETVINQSAQRAAIDWQSFDVSRGESVRFNQPNAAAATLNRVHAGRESVIAGAITAPGQVIIQNANGVVFTDTARVDVGSLIATSIGISDRNFTAGRLIFDQPGRPDAVVRNGGSITVADKGLAAFVAPGVANTGTVVARSGTVAMAAGNAATIDLHGDGLVSVAVTEPTTQRPRGLDALIEQGGVIRADGGKVIMTAEAAAGVVNSAINLTGLVQARSVAQQGGEVRLTSGSGAVALSGTVDATGAAGGGTIQVAAREVTVHAAAVLDASATDSGNGGAIAIRADRDAKVDGTLRAKGAGRGRGGAVATSARGRLTIGEHASVKIDGPGGGGGWLLDPASITVVPGGGSAGSIDAANAAAGASTIGAGTIVDALAGGSVSLLATDLIDVQTPIISGAPNSLQLIADGLAGTVRIGAPIRLANAGLALRGRRAVELNDGAQIDLGSGTAWLQTGTEGRITQAPSSAIVAGSLAALAADVDLTSWDNNVGILAGRATNGGFRFNQTNASGTTNIGTVTDPFAGETVAGIVVETIVPRGSQAFSATSPDGRLTLTLQAGGATFDRVIFTALPYGLLENTPNPLPTTDNSDYFIEQVAFRLLANPSTTWTLRPRTDPALTPAGFAVTAPFGLIVDDVNRWGVNAFTVPGPDNLNELQLNPITGASEVAMMALGGSTQSITVTFAQFFRPETSIPAIERGRIDYLAAVAGTPQLGVRQLPGPPTVPPQPPPGGDTPPGTGLPPDVVPPAAGGPAAAATLVVQRMVEPMFRGRDPDTPSDAIWRTTAMENLYVEDAFARPYPLGTVQGANLAPEQLGQIAPAAGPQSQQASGSAETSGQHALQTSSAPVLDINPVNLGAGAQQTPAEALGSIAPAAGPASPTRPTGPAVCGAASFLTNFWACR
jgi:filamentous hemagglutinin family protein